MFESDENNVKEEALKDKYAFGLRLDPDTGLPTITAMGRGRIAQEMVRRAKESNIPVEKEPALVKQMFKPKDDRVIPARTYGIIAEVLTLIYRLNEMYGRSQTFEDEEGRLMSQEEAEEENIGEEIAIDEEYYE